MFVVSFDFCGGCYRKFQTNRRICGSVTRSNGLQLGCEFSSINLAVKGAS